MKPAVVLTLNLLILVWSASHAKKEDCNVRQSSNFAKDAAKAARDIGGEAVNSITEAASFGKQALQGAADMGSAYLDMREANYIGADKYFHARGNSEAAKIGPGGKWPAEVIRYLFVLYSINVCVGNAGVIAMLTTYMVAQK